MTMLASASRRATRVLAALSLAFLATACDDDDEGVGPEPEPETTSIVLTLAGTGVANQTITWNTANGAVTPATITLAPGASRTVTAQFLRGDGTADPIVTSQLFRLDFNPTSGNAVTVAKNGNLAATITAGSTPGTTVLTMELFHLEENHEEYTSNAVTFQVQAP